MSISILNADAVRHALSIRDLTNPAEGPHALSILVDQIATTLSSAWSAELRVRRSSPIVSIADNYDRLRYPAGGAARDARYTRYVCDVALLRTHTSAMIPPLLRELAHDSVSFGETVLACPGLVYRRDTIDRTHTGEPHQLDLWRVRSGPRLSSVDLRDMIALVVAAALPGAAHRITPTEHPYTLEGLQIDVDGPSGPVEIGECGLAHPDVLYAAGLDPDRVSGLAMGVGLDRLLMLRKGIDDIRLLRSRDPRVSSQMLDLSPYRPVSAMPPIRRDLSIVVDEPRSAEEIGDRVRARAGERISAIESIEVVAETHYADLPEAARARLAIEPHQKNVLLRIVLRDLEKTLTHAEANELRDLIYGAVHEGQRHEWAVAHFSSRAASR